MVQLFLIGLYIFNLVAAFSLLFVHKKQTSVTIAWLLVFVFIPVLGFILYFFVGSTSKYQFFSKKFSPKHESLEKIPKNPDVEPQDMKPEALTNFDLINLNVNAAQSQYTQGNSAMLLPSAQEKFEIMFREIEQAKETINVLYFIIKGKDKSGKEFIELLARKARQGVQVRVIYDTFGYILGSDGTRRRDFKPLIDAGGMVYGYLPTFLRTALEANFRMHRKMVIIDGKIAYTGGINIGDDYLGLDPVKTPWRDTSIRIVGPAVRDIQLRFVKDWVYLDHLAYGKRKIATSIESDEVLAQLFPKQEKQGNMGVQIVCSGPDGEYSHTRNSYQRMISTTDKYIYIQTPYFVPDDGLLSTLRIASQSGMDVRVMLPGIPDKPYVYAITTSYIGELLSSGIKVYIHKGFLHAKTFVLDDAVASVGTTNFDIRSFDLDFEINAMIYDKEFAICCRDTFLKDIADCKEMSFEEYENRGLAAKIKEGFWRLIAPLV